MNTDGLQPLRKRQLIHEVIQEEIKKYIIENAMKPGDPLPPETDLARKLGVSRNSVREAVKSLEALGVIEARSGAGLFVRDFSFEVLISNMAYGLMFDVKQLTDVIEVRFHLEYGMSKVALDLTTPQQLARLKSTVDEMHENALRGEYSQELDRRFHQILWENVDNDILSRVLDVFWMVHQQAIRRGLLSQPSPVMRTYEGHRDIYLALEQKDLRAMQKAMVVHYAGTAERLNVPTQLRRIRLFDPDEHLA